MLFYGLPSLYTKPEGIKINNYITEKATILYLN